MKRFRNILASLDTRRETHPALETARVLAEQNGARLTLVDGVPEFSWPVRLALPNYAHAQELLVRDKKEQLEKLAAPLRAQGLDVATAAFSGKTSTGIIREVLRDGHDLVVRIAKGPESRRDGFFGNTTIRLFRNCPCAVWAISSEGTASRKKILAAVDPAPHDEEHARLNRTVMELSASLAEQDGVERHVIHVWSLFGESALASHLRPEDFQAVEANAEAQVNEAMMQFLADYGLQLGDPRVHLLKGDAAPAIADYIRDNGIDLLVLGTIGRKGVSAWVMGNTAEMILSRVQCAVLAIKPEGFVSPVTLG